MIIVIVLTSTFSLHPASMELASHHRSGHCILQAWSWLVTHRSGRQTRNKNVAGYAPSLVPRPKYVTAADGLHHG